MDKPERKHTCRSSKKHITSPTREGNRNSQYGERALVYTHAELSLQGRRIE